MRFFSRVILPLLLLIYIIVETYAKLHHTSICGTTGCELAGELLKFNSLYLNYFGAAGALLIALLGWLSRRSEAYERLFFITLYAAISFESIMISSATSSVQDTASFGNSISVRLLPATTTSLTFPAPGCLPSRLMMRSSFSMSCLST